jgi:2,3-bisphosphoglycerate-independent phosphoglycerate mutase
LASNPSYTELVVKYSIVIIDGASGWPLPERGMKTCLELAYTPNLDRMAGEGRLGLVKTVPEGMEPSSACACMSIIGYDPRMYYKGRSAIEAVSVLDGRMHDYSAGHISDDEARTLVGTLQESLGDSDIQFYPGVGYRHICKIKGHEEALNAICKPPHDIPGEPVDKYLPHGPGSDLLRDLMARSVSVLGKHPVNRSRESRGEPPANMIWLFWGSGEIPELPSFREVNGLGAAMSSGVDLLRGLAKMAGIDNLDIPGVTAGPDNDYRAQAEGAIKALSEYDVVFVHIEAPDEAAHAGNIDDKIDAIEHIDREVIGRLLSSGQKELRVLALPDHPTPIEVRTHVSDPVPFVLWGEGFDSMGSETFDERAANETGIFLQDGYTIIKSLIQG